LAAVDPASSEASESVMQKQQRQWQTDQTLINSIDRSMPANQAFRFAIDKRRQSTGSVFFFFFLLLIKLFRH
jgi:hypothetical protein